MALWIWWGIHFRILLSLVEGHHGNNSRRTRNSRRGSKHPIVSICGSGTAVCFSTFSYLVDYFHLHGFERDSDHHLHVVKAGLLVAIFMIWPEERLDSKFAILVRAGPAVRSGHGGGRGLQVLTRLTDSCVTAICTCAQIMTRLMRTLLTRGTNNRDIKSIHDERAVHPLRFVSVTGLFAHIPAASVAAPKCACSDQCGSQYVAGARHDRDGLTKKAAGVREFVMMILQRGVSPSSEQEFRLNLA